MSALDTVTGSFDSSMNPTLASATSLDTPSADVTAAVSSPKPETNTLPTPESPQPAGAATSSAPAQQDMTAWDEQGKQPGSTDSTLDAGTQAPALAPNAPTAPAEASQEEGQTDDGARHVLVQFRDALDQPIGNLEVSIPLPDGTVLNFKTTPQGTVTLPVPANSTGAAPVRVKDATGAQQVVCTLDMAQCQHAVIVRSPKTVAKGKLRQHQQSAAKAAPAGSQASSASSGSAAKASIAGSSASTAKVATKAASAAPAADAPSGSKSAQTSSADTTHWWEANGSVAHGWQWIRQELGLGGEAPATPPPSATLAKGLSDAGQPVTAMVGPECPNADGLRLGKDNIYRTDILAAAKRASLVPQALCALIECEAARIKEKVVLLGKDGKPLKNKKGDLLTRDVPGAWNAQSGASDTSAAGLTQFLITTWLGITLNPSYYIHDRCVEAGWVKQETVRGTKGSQWVFVLANGTTTSKPASASISDANIHACLAKRLDPTWSIYAAADYAVENLGVLQRKFSLNGLTDMQKAKLIYLMHHEGDPTGPRFIKSEMVGDDASKAKLKRTFYAQFGKTNKAAGDRLLDQAGGDVEKAYRTWLAKYIDDKFATASKFFCSAPAEIPSLSSILKKIGGVEIA